MPKIQILNETQVKHFVDFIMPDLEKEFSKIREGLEKQAKDEMNNFMESEEVLDYKKERKELFNRTLEIVKLLKPIKKFSKSFHLVDRDRLCSWDIASAEEYLSDPVKYTEGFDKDTDVGVNSIALSLSEKNVHIYNIWERKSKMADELKARLCMVTVADADTIKKLMLEQIEVESFFTE